MIKQEEVVPLILEACPSFQEEWDSSDDKELLYVVMGDLARHLLSLYLAKRTDEFGPLCKVIERLHVHGDDFVRELATIGFLEGVQNVWGNNDTDPENFCRFLSSESRRWWEELNAFWRGERHYVGEGLQKQMADADIAQVRQDIRAFNKRLR